MILEPLSIPGVVEVRTEPVLDERGLFARTYDAAEFAEHGLPLVVAQASVSYNTRSGTLRGLHLQLAPHQEAKLVRCLAGAVYDVVVDLRAGSPTQLAWVGIELTAAARNAVYVPPGCAHGFLTLEERCELEYLISAAYVPAAATGVRWDDPVVGVAWPFEPAVISARDAGFPDLDVERVRRQGPEALGTAGGTIR